MKNMLVHACCAPCSIYTVKYWRSLGIEPVLFFFNPNIHPYSEYLSRRQALEQLEQDDGVRIIFAGDYPLTRFLKGAIHPQETGFGSRCEFCYGMRLEATAEIACDAGFSEFSTTLLISPYQQHELVIAEGMRVALAGNLIFAQADLRPGFRESQNEARTRGYYRQKYCGCLFSELDRRGLPV